MALLNLLSFIGLILIFYRLIWEIHKDKIAQHFSVLFLACGMNSCGILFFLYKLLNDNGQKVNLSNVFGILSSISFKFDIRVSSFVHKFLVGNNVPLGIFLLALSIFFIFRIISHKKFNITDTIKLSLILFLLSFTQSIFAFALGCSLLLYIILLFFCRLFKGKLESNGIESHFYSLLISMSLGLLIPYLYNQSLRETKIPIIFSGDYNIYIINFIGLFLVEGVVIILSLIGFWKVKMKNNGVIFIYILAITSAILSFSTLPGGNQYKFLYVAQIPFSILAGIGASKIYIRKYSKILISLLAIIMLSTSIFVSYNYLNIKGDEGFDKEELEMGEFINRNSPQDAVFLENNFQHPIVPVLSSRKDYIAFPSTMILWGYSDKEVSERKALAELVFSSTNISDVTELYLQLKKENVNYVLLNSHVHNNLFEDEKIKLVFENSKYKLYQIT